MRSSIAFPPENNVFVNNLKVVHSNEYLPKLKLAINHRNKRQDKPYAMALSYKVIKETESHVIKNSALRHLGSITVWALGKRIKVHREDELTATTTKKKNPTTTETKQFFLRLSKKNTLNAPSRHQRVIKRYTENIGQVH